jgi:hypothetical protein
MRERAGSATDPLFPTRQGHPLSVDAIQWLLANHVNTAKDFASRRTPMPRAPTWSCSSSNLPRRDGREVLAGVDPGLAWSASWSRRSFS